MSSTEFSAELHPDKRLRKGVILSGAIAAIAGLSLVLHMPLSVISRFFLAVLWLAWSSIEISVLTRAWSRVHRIGINQLGEVWVTDHSGQRSPVSLLRGSIVIGRFAWLRMCDQNGLKYAELVSGSAVEDRQWHRFQLIWKQSRQIVGRTD